MTMMIVFSEAFVLPPFQQSVLHHARTVGPALHQTPVGVRYRTLGNSVTAVSSRPYFQTQFIQ